MGACLVTNYVSDLDVLGLVDGVDYISYTDEIDLVDNINRLFSGRYKDIGSSGNKKIEQNDVSIEGVVKEVCDIALYNFF